MANVAVYNMEGKEVDIFENGHITVRVSPSQELSDWLLDALHDGGQE